MKSKFVFSRNPVIIEDNHTSGVSISGGKLTFENADKILYEARVSTPFRIDIAEILDTLSFPIEDVPANNTLPVVTIEDQEQLSRRLINVKYDCNGYDNIWKYIVIPGGISRQNHNFMVQHGKDIFSDRFNNPYTNFFLTTRTAEWTIILKETELYPLYFIASNTAVLEIRTVTASCQYRIGNLDPGLYALDLNALRLYFQDYSQLLANAFEIYVDGIKVMRIIIERSRMSKVRHRIKFRNSLGVFEIMELTGDISYNPEYEKIENSTFKRYDQDTGYFSTGRHRIERKQVISTTTGVKRSDEIRLFMDMIASEEVYLLDIIPEPIQVIPSIENLKYELRPENPQNFTLKLEIADTDTNISQDIIGGIGSKPGIFTRQFSTQFN